MPAAVSASLLVVASSSTCMPSLSLEDAPLLSSSAAGDSAKRRSRVITTSAHAANTLGTIIVAPQYRSHWSIERCDETIGSLSHVLLRACVTSE